ncbi:unnamed protein product [Rhodiola kirilowii]
MAEVEPAAAMERWRALEFYSGIGGLRYSLERARVSATVVEAFDINDMANDVYEHNFGHRPFQGNIQTLTAADLDLYEAHVWLLSPPCQPYTRQGLQKGSADARALSFLTILELIPYMSKPPVMLFVENVVGFETSDTHSMMVELFEKSDFVTQEFILSPLQFGVPYSRPRYYCLAKRKPSSFKHPQFNNELLSTADLLVGDNGAKSSANFEGKASTDNEKFLQHCEPIERFLEDELVSSHLSMYLVPPSLIERWGSAMGILLS